jgi:hypothetical protein
MIHLSCSDRFFRDGPPRINFAINKTNCEAIPLRENISAQIVHLNAYCPNNLLVNICRELFYSEIAPLRVGIDSKKVRVARVHLHHGLFTKLPNSTNYMRRLRFIKPGKFLLSSWDKIARSAIRTAQIDFWAKTGDSFRFVWKTV